MTYFQLLEAYLNFQNCTECDLETGTCTLGDKCADNIKLLNRIKTHYKGGRKLIDKIYNYIDSSMKYIHCIDLALREKDYAEMACLLKFIPKRIQALCDDRLKDLTSEDFQTREELHNQDYIQNTYGAAIAKFRESLSKENWDNHTCNVCNRFVFKDDLAKPVKGFLQYNELLLCPKGSERPFDINVRIERYLREELQLNINDLKICTHCWKNMRSGEIPNYSKWNNMHVENIPKEFENMTKFDWVNVQKVKPLKKTIVLETVANKD